MEFELNGDKLTIKSNAFSDKDVVEFIGDVFPYIMKDFFENEHIHSMHDFIVNWKELKSSFELFFHTAMLIAII